MRSARTASSIRRASPTSPQLLQFASEGSPLCILPGECLEHNRHGSAARGCFREVHTKVTCPQIRYTDSESSSGFEHWSVVARAAAEHTSRNFPLKLSTHAFSIGLPGRMNRSSTPDA
jgi:hypothetical protein